MMCRLYCGWGNEILVFLGHRKELVHLWKSGLYLDWGGKAKTKPHIYFWLYSEDKNQDYWRDWL